MIFRFSIDTGKGLISLCTLRESWRFGVQLRQVIKKKPMVAGIIFGGIEIYDKNE